MNGMTSQVATSSDTAKQLQRFVDRYETLEEEKKNISDDQKSISDDQKELLEEMSGLGFRVIIGEP